MFSPTLHSTFITYSPHLCRFPLLVFFMITLVKCCSSGHIITDDFIGDVLARHNKMNVSHICFIYLPIFQGHLSELLGLMFFFYFNKSSQHYGFGVPFCLQQEDISYYLKRKGWGKTIWNDQPLKVRLMATAIWIIEIINPSRTLDTIMLTQYLIMHSYVDRNVKCLF